MEYSALYRVSLSTLRRRIKAGEIEFKLIEGKYLLKNGPLPATTQQSVPEAIAPPTSGGRFEAASRTSGDRFQAISPKLVSAQYTPAKAVAKSEPVSQVRAPPPAMAPTGTASPRSSVTGDDQFWKATQGLLNEIKKAYSLILQEKEEQILQIKDEVADLKTLVRVLEDDNLRLKSSQPSQDFDLGLEV